MGILNDGITGLIRSWFWTRARGRAIAFDQML
jgi:hypothetical protein